MKQLLRLLIALPVCLGAQTPSSSAPIASVGVVARANALLARGDSTRALQLLGDAAAAAPRDAELWHAYGKLASDLSRPEWRKGFIRSQRAISLIIAAESSLARATWLAPDSARYLLDYGKHLWGTNITSLSTADRSQLKAVQAAARLGDSTTAALSADEIGIMLWRRYEGLMYRLAPWVSTWTTSAEMNDAVQESAIMPLKADGIYNLVLSYFHYAATVAPDNITAVRHEMMAFASKNRWPDVSAIGRERTRLFPREPWGWLGFALGEYRLGHRVQAMTAFDRAFALMSPSERARLTNLSVLLPAKEGEAYSQLKGAQRAAYDAAFWVMSSPSWLSPVNDVRNEFLARVVYAELMWTSDEQHVHGLNTNRGSVYVRLGPPDVMVRPSEISESWLYRRLRLHFNFDDPLWRGTAYYTFDTDDEHRAPGASDWTNIPLLRHGLDTISTRVARFRAPADSFDLALFANVRTGRLTRGLPADSGRLENALFVLSADGREQSRLVRTLTVPAQDSTVEQVVEWRPRISTTGTAVRVEALQPDLPRAAKTVIPVYPLEANGFGLSDILVANRIRPHSDNAARWTDFDIIPSRDGTFHPGQSIDLLWESYELAALQGQLRYRVSVRVEHHAPGGLKAFAARIIGGLGNLVRASNAGPDQLTVSFDRQQAAAPVVANYLSLDLGQISPGRCTITVVVLDLVSGRTELASQDIVLTP